MAIGAGDNTDIYAPPVRAPDLADCYFYHTMDIPGHGVVQGEWDLRGKLDAYLGNVDFRGKRVLELGTADGYLTFHIEGKGADVVSYDVSEKDRLDTVPFARLGPSPSVAEFTSLIPKLNNAYWFCHNAFGSTARLVHGDIYSVPKEIGAVDVTVFGALLLHTRDPFLAMVPAVQLTTETVIVTEGLGRLRLPAPLRWMRQALPMELRRPAMRFVPDWRTSSGPHGWWRLTPDIVQAFLGVLGFERSEVSTHTQLYNGRERRLFTVVGHRTVAMAATAAPTS